MNRQFNLNDFIKDIKALFFNTQGSNIFNNQSYANEVKEIKKNGWIKALIITLVLAMIIEWFFLIPINLRSPSFIFFLGLLLAIFTLLSYIFSRYMSTGSKVTLTITILCVIVLVVGNIISLPVFHASEYQKQLSMNENANFTEDIDKVNFKTIPVVDRDSAQRLGNKQMGSIVDYVSQFEVDDDYTQINYQDEPYRVTTISYSGLIKWFTNHANGLPAYIRVNMVDQKAEVVRLENPMKYSYSDMFLRDIDRHIRINYPTLMFDEPDFEIDDDGVPYYIASTYTYKIGLFGGKDITGAIIVNAVTGESKYYNVSDIPEWVDRVYSEELLMTQLENWGQYKNGFFNTLFSQKGVLTPTDGYNYIALDDDVYMYTGLTSVSSDASNVGFALINCRTKEANYYSITGADESSAQSSAEGKVQNLGYTATFPILINSGGEPTYFLSLKDDAGLVKKYAFVNVKNYQIVATGDSVEEAQEAYFKLLSTSSDVEVETDSEKYTANVSDIQTAIVEGNTQYYLKLEGSDNIYIVDISQSDELPFLKAGQNVTVTYNKTDGNIIVVKSIVIN